MRTVRDATPRADVNRVEYSRGGLTEWYVNGPAGLEQGFTLARRPAGGGGPLTLRLGLHGSVTTRLDPDGLGATFRAGNGSVPLAYSGLWAADARGRPLRAWLERRGADLLVRVADAAARYPVIVDPFFQAAKLTASDGAADDRLGLDVAIAGETIVAGAHGENQSRGAAYVFVRPPGGWANATQAAKLTASDGAQGDGLGFSVGVAGDTVVAGASGDDQGRGSVYVFRRPPGGWANATQAAKLTASDGAASDVLGASMAIAGDTVVAGAYGDDEARGSAYVFTKPGSGWANGTQSAKLSASDRAAGDGLGFSVDVAGDTVVAGAWSDNQGRGSAYVFTRPPGGWANATQSAKLTASDGAASDGLGAGVAIAGDTVVAGAYADDENRGAAYVFTKPGSGWASGTQSAKLTASDRAASDQLGYSVGVAGDTVVAGAWGDDDGRGSAYVFRRPPGGWANATESVRLTASDRAASDHLGWSAQLAGDTVVAGALGDEQSRGSAYVFVEDIVAPGAPALTATVPDSPANANTVTVKGTADSGATIRVYAGSGCSGAPVAEGTAGAFASSGLQVSVGDDRTTTFHATATDAAGNTSGCSSSSIDYVEDSTPPAAPTFADISPRSPANSNTVSISGSAEAGARVRVYVNDTCLGAPLAEGAAGVFGAPGLSSTVGNDTATRFHATATDVAGNTSPCSTSAIGYVEDSAAPAPPTLNGPTRPTVGEPARFTAAVVDTGGGGVDPEAVLWTASGGLPQRRGSIVTYRFPATGTYRLRATATDRAGNVSRPGSIEVTVIVAPMVQGVRFVWQDDKTHIRLRSIMLVRLEPRDAITVRCQFRRCRFKPLRRTVEAGTRTWRLGPKVFGRKGLKVPRGGAVEVRIERADGSVKRYRLVRRRSRAKASLTNECRYVGQRRFGRC